MASKPDPTSVVTQFCAAWGTGDLDVILDFFTPDALYHNIPMAPVTGVDEIRALIAGFTAGVDKIEFRVKHQAANGNVVMNERVDAFITADRTIELPVMGVFEVTDDGKISAWRDYFDLNQFMSQMAPS
jgi:limonene-1,2-epoxide hydrolase